MVAMGGVAVGMSTVAWCLPGRLTVWEGFADTPLTKRCQQKMVAERQNMGGVGRAVPGSSGSFYLRVRWPQVVFLRKIVFW
jgi:hypothetical protein